MESVTHYYYLVKNNLIKQMRSYSFLLVVALTIFLGYACVPTASDGYEVFYIGGVRGIYNSAWLGGMAAMLSTLLLWLFGFFMLRSEISEDQRLKVGQIIASNPISNLRYVSIKAVSNFVVLLVIDMILVVAFMAMQLFRGEDVAIQLGGYLLPFLFITLPSLFVLAAFTVLFDVFPGLKGVIGNLIFFALWMFFSVISIASPKSLWDMFGFHVILGDMVEEATVKFEFLKNSQEGGSFGYYPIEGAVRTFVWQGVEWDIQLLALRLIWVIAAIVLIQISSLLFIRFKSQKEGVGRAKPSIFENRQALPQVDFRDIKLSSVQKEGKIRLNRLIKAELTIMLKSFSIWWYLLVGVATAGYLFIPLDKIQGWMPIAMLFPLSIWSQMGTRERHYFTRDILKSSCSPFYKFMVVWFSGIIVTLIISLGPLIHFVLEDRLTSVYSWMVGALFIPTLALALGYWSGSRKLFEVLFMLWWYMGPLQDIPYMNFLNGPMKNVKLYSIFTVVLFLIAFAGLQVREGGLLVDRVSSAHKELRRDYSKGGTNEKAEP